LPWLAREAPIADALVLHTGSGPLAFEHREVPSRARHWFEAHLGNSVLVGAVPPAVVETPGLSLRGKGRR
jgi:hypothetical protein